MQTEEEYAIAKLAAKARCDASKKRFIDAYNNAGTARVFAEATIDNLLQRIATRETKF